MQTIKWWDLKDPKLPQELHKIRDVFIGPIDDRRRGESLHSYLIRKNIQCFCKNCRIELMNKKNAQLEI